MYYFILYSIFQIIVCGKVRFDDDTAKVWDFLEMMSSTR